MGKAYDIRRGEKSMGKLRKISRGKFYLFPNSVTFDGRLMHLVDWNVIQLDHITSTYDDMILWN